MLILNLMQIKCTLIREGLDDNLDVSWYAKPEFNEDQMEEIRSSLYYNEYQMREIVKGLKWKDDVSSYADPKYSWEQMEQIRLGDEKGLDVSLYANPELSWGKIQQIRWELENSLGVKDNKFIID